MQPFFLIVSDAAVASIVDYDDAPIWSSDTGAVDAVGTADGREDGGTEPAASWLDWMIGSVRPESAQPVDAWEPRSADASELAKAFEVPHGPTPTASEICLPLSRGAFVHAWLYWCAAGATAAAKDPASGTAGP